MFVYHKKLLNPKGKDERYDAVKRPCLSFIDITKHISILTFTVIIVTKNIKSIRYNLLLFSSHKVDWLHLITIYIYIFDLLLSWWWVVVHYHKSDRVANNISRRHPDLGRRSITENLVCLVINWQNFSQLRPKIWDQTDKEE